MKKESGKVRVSKLRIDLETLRRLENGEIVNAWGGMSWVVSLCDPTYFPTN